jgi:hypothetical protein
MIQKVFRRWHKAAPLCAGVCGLFVVSIANAATPTIEWIRQFGTSGHDFSLSMASDSLGNAYVNGYTTGSLGGPNSGANDAYLTKFNSSGVLQWTKQFGTSEEDYTQGVTVDGSGNIVLAGFTFGDLDGTNAGGYDAIAAKFDSAGNLQWTRQLGSVNDDFASGAAADSLGNVYLSGSTDGNLGGPNSGSSDSFVAKYSPAGNLLWIKQQGSSADEAATNLTVDSGGNIFAAGNTFGNLADMSVGGRDGYVTRYDAAGNLVWSKQFGTSANENVLGASADDFGNVYITGQTFGNWGGPNAGSSDIFVVKYDLAGNQQWVRQLGTTRLDISCDVIANDFGDVFISGWTADSPPSDGGRDVFVSKLDATGNWIWTKHIGSAANEEGWGIAANADGSVYVSGITEGVLGDSHAGGLDAFVLKINEVPEPLASTLLVLAFVAISCRRTRASAKSLV